MVSCCADVGGSVSYILCILGGAFTSALFYLLFCDQLLNKSVLKI